VDIDKYKQRLLALERHLSGRVGGEIGSARQLKEPGVEDAGDTSVADEEADEDLTQAELDSVVLRQVRDALERIERGTFGTCQIDGKPIPESRLDASPWVPYCLRYQKLLEAAAGRRFPTL